jgi:polyphenol oxidase
MQADWLVPDWPAPPNVRAVFSMRSGGVSQPPFDTMNLGDHVGDAPHHVATNRARLQAETGVPAVFLRQVHGTHAQPLTAATPQGTVADACFTTHPRLACTIMVADCLPVLLCTRDGALVGAAHAGWRGLAGEKGEPGVLEALLVPFQALAQQIRALDAPEIIAWMGPCIGPHAFEVGAEVRDAFVRAQPGAKRAFEPLASGKFMADLAMLARQRLHALGVHEVHGNDGSPGWCTVGNPARFFSHRRDAGPTGNGAGTTGRMAACVWRA